MVELADNDYYRAVMDNVPLANHVAIEININERVMKRNIAYITNIRQKMLDSKKFTSEENSLTIKNKKIHGFQVDFFDQPPKILVRCYYTDKKKLLSEKEIEERKNNLKKWFRTTMETTLDAEIKALRAN